jgi:hypothetical protein
MQAVTKAGRVKWTKGKGLYSNSLRTVLQNNGAQELQGTFHGSPVEGRVYIWYRGDRSYGARVRLSWRGYTDMQSVWAGGLSVAQKLVRDRLRAWEYSEALNNGVAL